MSSPRAPRPLLSRRGVLKWGVGGLLALSGCASSRPRATPATPTTATTAGTSTTAAGGPPGEALWQQLRSRLTGHLVRPGDPAYTAARRLYDFRFDVVAPAAVAYCASADDVARCLEFARAHQLPLTARSGGHSYAGYSTSTGMVIDVSLLNRVSTAGHTATVGAGARLLDVYTALNAKGMSIPAGSCPTVGIAGLTLGGGAGVTGRAYGMTCDRLTSLQLVTADGRTLTADAGSFPDLYWASRGGGGGNYAVVVSFTFSAFSTAGTVVWSMAWPWEAAGQVLPAWLAWAPTQPDPLWSNCILQTDPAKPAPEVQVGGVWLGAPTLLSPLLTQLTKAVGSPPPDHSTGPTSFARAMYVEGGCAQLSQSACQALPPRPSLAKSDYLTSPLSDAGVGAVISGIDQRRHMGGKAAVGYDAYGGAINRVASDATAFVHRSTLASAQYNVPLDPGTPADAVAASQAWLDSWYEGLRGYVSGAAYQNYIDPGLVDWAQAYYGANLPRLQKVKRAWDPDNVFHFAQSIPLT